MAKLTTAALKTLLTTKAQDAYPYDAAYYAEQFGGISPERESNWKRLSKTKASTALVNFGCCDPEDVVGQTDKDFEQLVLDNLGGDHQHVLDPQTITPDCVIRHFCIPDLTMDCTVVTDPKDERVLQLLWHQD